MEPVIPLNHKQPAKSKKENNIKFNLKQIKTKALIVSTGEKFNYQQFEACAPQSILELIRQSSSSLFPPFVLIIRKNKSVVRFWI